MKDIIDYYATYSLAHSGKIGNTYSFDLVKEIETKFAVDTIKLHDGTKIWNLLRILLYQYPNIKAQETRTTKRELLRTMPLKTLMAFALYRYTGERMFTIRNGDILQKVIDFVSSETRIDKVALQKSVYEFILVFYHLKLHYQKDLQKRQRELLFIGCGYGRIPMALVQAHKELGILTYERQHGIITPNILGYIRTTPTENRDCIPDYFIADDAISADIVKTSSLFKKENVIQHKITILFASQWIFADEIKTFVEQLANTIAGKYHIILKPHPLGKFDYSNLARSSVTIAGKNENIYKLMLQSEIIATVYSATGMEAIKMNKPVIFVDLKRLRSSCICDKYAIVHDSNDFVKAMEVILKRNKLKIQ